MVKVENLEGDELWTFPKGHIEKGEKAPQAALREVEEETGYRCEIVKPFERVQYYVQAGRSADQENRHLVSDEAAGKNRDARPGRDPGDAMGSDGRSAEAREV